MMLLFLLIFGVFIGFIAGFFGIGGGAIIVPTMLMLGFDMKAAIGVSIFQMLFSSVFGSYFNYKDGNLKLDNGVFLGLGGAVGASFSGYIVSITPDIVLKLALLSIFIISIIKLYYNPKQAKKLIISKAILFAIGIGVGALAISVGIGGSVFITPILVGFLGLDIKKASSMGLFFVIFSSFSGFLSFAYHGYIAYLDGILIGLGSIVGVFFGTRASNKIDKKLLKKYFLGLYLFMSAFLIYKIVF
nr:sulfite exporter TauE/SafE family protein [Campylobacter pinnipediorum]